MQFVYKFVISAEHDDMKWFFEAECVYADR